MSRAHTTTSATKQTTLDRCIEVCRKWGPPLLLTAVGFTLGWL